MSELKLDTLTNNELQDYINKQRRLTTKVAARRRHAAVNVLRQRFNTLREARHAMRHVSIAPSLRVVLRERRLTQLRNMFSTAYPNKAFVFAEHRDTIYTRYICEPWDATAVDRGYFEKYSRSKSYWRSDIYCQITVPSFRDAILRLRIVAGMPTAMLDDNSAVWFANSRGHQLRCCRGYVIDGYHFECDTSTISFASAVDERRRQQAERKLITKRKRAAKNWPLEYIFVCRDDSIAAGNCKTGTDSFISHLPIQVGAIRADILMSYAKQYDVEKWARLAVEYARNNH